MDITERRARRLRRLEMAGEKKRKRTNAEFRADNLRLKAEYDAASSDEERSSIEALFLEQNSGQVREYAWRLRGQDGVKADGQVSDMDDLVQEGFRLAVTAFRRWDPSKGSWGQWLQMHLKRLSVLVWREDFKSMRQEQFFARPRVKKMVAAGKSIEEIADAVGQDVDWVSEILFPERAHSLDFVLSESDESGELTLGDKVVDEKAVVDYQGDFWDDLNDALDYVGAQVFVGRRTGQVTTWPVLRKSWLAWALDPDVTILSLLPEMGVSREQARLRLYAVSAALAHPVCWARWPQVAEVVAEHLATIKNRTKALDNAQV